MAQKLTEELREKLTTEDRYIKLKEIDGVIIGVLEWAFTIAIMYDVDVNGGYEYRFCYPYANTIECLMAFEVWNGIGDPPGPWLKNKGYGLDRRNPLIPDPFEEKLKAIKAERDKLKTNK